LAQKWKVQLFDDLPDGSQLQSSTPSASDPNELEVTRLPAPDPSVWDSSNSPIEWAALSIPDIQSGPFTGPDATLFSAYPSAELEDIYESMGILMDVTQELDSWWFMGSQPSVEFKMSGRRPDPSGEQF
jgi:hypothetical protein